MSGEDEGYGMVVKVEAPSATGLTTWRATTLGGDACTGQHADPYLATVAAVARKGYSFHEDQLADSCADPAETELWRRLMAVVDEVYP